MKRQLSDADHELAVLSRGDVEQQLALIFTMVRECRWNKLKTARELADVWRMDIKEVQRLYRETLSGIHEQIAASGANLAAELIERLDHIVNESMSATKTVVVNDGEESYTEAVPAPDYASAIKAIDKIAEISGVKAAKKRITVNYTEMTREQLLAQARKEIGDRNEKALPGKRTIESTGTEIEGQQDAELSPARTGRS